MCGVQYIFSAGGLVYKKDPDLKLLLIQVKNPKGRLFWQLPKGKIEKGEKVEDAAVREVEEETGIKVEAGERLHEIDYIFRREGELYKKKVYFLLMRCIGGELKPQEEEVEAVDWFDPDKALVIMTFTNEKKVVEKALGLLKQQS